MAPSAVATDFTLVGLSGTVLSPSELDGGFILTL